MEVVKEHFLLHSFTFRFQVNYNETTLFYSFGVFAKHETIFFFQLIGHFVSTHI